MSGTSTDVAVIYATGKSWFRVPYTIRVNLHGVLQPGVYAKDICLALAKLLDVDGATSMSVEYGGEAVQAMEISERMTLANMSIEMGAKAGLVEPDQKTYDYVAPRARDPFEPLVQQREKLILKRLNATPLPRWAFVGSNVAVRLVIAAVQTTAPRGTRNRQAKGCPVNFSASAAEPAEQVPGYDGPSSSTWGAEAIRAISARVQVQG